MSTRNTTGSSLHLASKCPASHTLQWVKRITEYMEGGTEQHRLMEAYALGQSISCPVPSLCLPFASWTPEVAIAWNPFTSVARKLPGFRQYDSLTEDEIGLTIDAVHDGDSLIVCDWKSGHKKVAHPRENWQVKAAARAASLLYRRPRVTGMVFYVYPPYECESHAFDEWDLDQIDEDAAKILMAIKAESNRPSGPSFSPGLHCARCPGLVNCPTQRESLSAMTTAPITAITPDNAADVYTRLKAGTELLASIKAALDSYAEQSEIHLPDGRVYGMTDGQERIVDQAKAAEVLASVLGDEGKARLGGGKWSTSKSAIKEAYPERYAEICESLRTSGAMRADSRLSEYQPKTRRQ